MRPRGRAVATTEMMQIILGKPQVYCNIEFIPVCTLPLGERPGVERKSPMEKFKELTKAGIVEPGKDSFDYMVPLVRFWLQVSKC